MKRAIVIFVLATSLLLAAAAPSSATTLTDFPITTPGSHEPRFLDTGPDGKIWYTDGGSPGGIGSIGLSGSPQAQIFTTEPAFDLAVADDGAAYWTGLNSNNAYRRTPGVGTPDSITDSNFWGVAVDASSTAQFGEREGGGPYTQRICNIDWGHFTTCNTIGTTTAAARPTGVEFGPDGHLWVTIFEADRVVRKIDTPPYVETFQLPTDAAPYQLTSGPDGNIWVPEYGLSAIVRITPTGDRQTFPLPPKRGPNDIVTGPDGNLWFPEYLANKIGCMTTSGKISEYDVPTPGVTAPFGVTDGPDGAIWFSEWNTGKIGRLVPNTPCGGDAGAVAVGSGSGASDTTAPSFSTKLSLSPSKFRVAPGATALSASKHKAPAGSKFTYTLSEAATVTIAIQRPSKGRKVGGKCKKKTSSNRKRAKCTFYKTAGTLTRKAAQGADNNTFSGRLGTKKLKRGAYRAVAIAKDAAGNASKASTASFKIVR